MTRNEDQPQQVIPDRIVERCVEVALAQLLSLLQLVFHLRVLAVEHLAPAKVVQRPMLCGRHEPGARFVRDAGLGPPLQRRDERILSQVFR